MASEKAIYWMAVGLVALVASNHFVERFDGRVVMARATAVVQGISGDSGHLLALANRASGRCTRSQTVIAHAQSRLASVQAMMARREVACARAEAAQARLMAIQQMRAMPNLSSMPKVNIPEIKIPEINPEINIPEISLQQVRVNVDGQI
jgi:hypothetical protein